MRRGAAGSTGTWPFSGRAGAPCGGGARGGARRGEPSPPTQRRLAYAERSLNQETRLLAQGELGRVEDLLDQMLDLLAVRVAAGTYLATVDRKALLAEMEQVMRRARETRDDPDLDRVETQRLEVLQKRLGERAEMERNLEIVTSQIATLEHSIAYLADKLQTRRAAGRC